MSEDPPDDLVSALLGRLRVGCEIDALEHEGTQRRHRLADLVALSDVAGGFGGLDQVVNERVDPPRACRSEKFDLPARELRGREHAGADRVIDVVVDVGDAVDEPDDLALERVWLVLARVVEDPIPDLCRQVEPATVALEMIDHAQGVLVVAKAEPEPLAQGGVECFLARVPEGRMPEIVTESDRLRQILVQAQRPGDTARNAGGLERVLEAAERLRVDDPVAIPLERRPQPAVVLEPLPATRLVRADS